MTTNKKIELVVRIITTLVFCIGIGVAIILQVRYGFDFGHSLIVLMFLAFILFIHPFRSYK